MKWNVLMLVVALVALFVVGFAEPVIDAVPLAQAERYAENLAPKLGVSEDLLRKELGMELRETDYRKFVINVVLLSLVPVLLLIRMTVEKRKRA